MIRFSQFITEAKYHKIFEKISDDDIEFLLYLVHDKSHVMDNTRPIPNMERVLKLTKRLAILPRLYRGLHTQDIEVFKKHMEDGVNKGLISTNAAKRDEAYDALVNDIFKYVR